MPRRLVRVATGWYKTPASSRPARAVVTCRERRMLHFLFFTRLRQDKRKPLVSLMLVSLACVSFVLPRLEVLCAVAYADKGSGTGLHTFDDDTINLRNGTRSTRSTAGTDAIFSASLGDAATGD